MGGKRQPGDVARRRRRVGVAATILVVSALWVGGCVALVAAITDPIDVGGVDFDVCRTSESEGHRLARQDRAAELGGWIDAGGDPNSIDADANTPLGCGIPSRSMAAVVVLLDKGADPNVSSGRRQADQSSPDYEELPLNLAMEDDDPRWRRELVSRLLVAGADPDRSIPAERLPMETAFALDPDLVPLLLDAGASASGRPGARPLILAQRLGRSDLVDLLLSRGADLGAPEGPASTTVVDHLLVASAGAGDATSTRRWLSAGADPSAAAGAPLLASLRSGSAATTPMLLEAGADPNRARSSIADLVGSDQAFAAVFGGTAVPQAAPGHRAPGPVAVSRLLGAAPRGTSGVMGTVPGSTVPGSATRPPDFAATVDAPPVAVAALYGDGDAVRSLLDRGADPNAQLLGHTPLQFAALDCSEAVASALLGAGAAVTPMPDGTALAGVACPEVAALLPEG